MPASSQLLRRRLFPEASGGASSRRPDRPRRSIHYLTSTTSLTLGFLEFSSDELIVHLPQSIGPVIPKGQEKAGTPGQKGCHRALPGVASVLMGRSKAHEPRHDRNAASWARQVVSCQRPTTPTQKEVDPVDLVQTARDRMEVER